MKNKPAMDRHILQTTVFIMISSLLIILLVGLFISFCIVQGNQVDPASINVTKEVLMTLISLVSTVSGIWAKYVSRIQDRKR